MRYLHTLVDVEKRVKKSQSHQVPSRTVNHLHIFHILQDKNNNSLQNKRFHVKK